MMCNVRLIYLGDNKYGEIKCKPEMLSPLPKQIQPKQEKPTTNPTVITSLNPAIQEVVVGILDESQTSCTLVSVPTSPQASEIEAAKTLLIMKDKDGSFSVETAAQNVEISTNEPTNGELTAKVSKEDLESIAPTNTMDNDATEVPIETLITNPYSGTTSDTMMQTDPPVETEYCVETENVTNFVDVNASNSAETVASAPENLQGPLQTDNTLPSRPVTPVVQLLENKPLPEQLPVKSINVKNNVNIETKSCIVRLEILTEADIVKYVHVHRNNQLADPMRVKGAPVETVETKYRTRSSVQTKPP